MKKLDLSEACAKLDRVGYLLGRPLTDYNKKDWTIFGLLEVRRAFLNGGGSIEVGFTKYPKGKHVMFAHIMFSRKLDSLEQQKEMVLQLVKDYPKIEVSYEQEWLRDWNNNCAYHEKTHVVTRTYKYGTPAWPIDQEIADVTGQHPSHYKKAMDTADMAIHYSNL